MAVIGTVTPLFSDSGAQRAVLMRAVNVSSGDTIDVSSVGSFPFSKVQAAVIIGHDQRTPVIVTPGTGTVLTLTSPGLANDTVDILVLGE